MVTAIHNPRVWLQVLLLTALGLLPFSMAQAALTASVDRSTISKNDIIQLTIRSDKGPMELADFSALEKNFSVINKRRSNQISIINGHQQVIYDLNLALFPKRDGSLTIPAFKSQGESSQPIQIEVSAGSADPQQSREKVFLKTEISKQEVYVQEQLLFTLRLFHAVGLSEAQLTPLQVENAVVQPVGEQKKYESVLNGIRYSVIEKQYSVIPEKSGHLILPELVFAGRTAPNRSIYSQSSQYIRRHSVTYIVKVLPKPANYPAGEPWLPTSALNISDSWSNAAPALTVGEPVTRTLTLSALNLDAAQLPDLKSPSVTNLKMYPDKVQNDNNITAAGLVGQRSFATAIVPTKAGQIDMPAIKIVWWNTNSKQVEESIVPAKKLKVSPAAQTNNVNQALNTPLNSAPTENATPPQSNQAPSGVWPLISLIFALLWLSTAIMWWRGKQAVSTKKTDELQPALTNQTVRAAYKALKKACTKDDAKTARQSLLDWFRLSHTEQHIQQLMDITQLYQDDELTRLIRELEIYLYGSTPTATSWHGAPLIGAIERLEKADTQQLRGSGGNRLKPLYPL